MSGQDSFTAAWLKNPRDLEVDNGAEPPTRGGALLHSALGRGGIAKQPDP